MRFIEIENASRIQVRKNDKGHFIVYCFEDHERWMNVVDDNYPTIVFDKRTRRKPNQDKHYHGKPCKKCGSTLRYKKWCNCVSCHRKMGQGGFYEPAEGDRNLAVKMFLAGERVSKIQQKLNAPRSVVIGYLNIEVSKNGRYKKAKEEKQIDWIESHKQTRRIDALATNGRKD